MLVEERALLLGFGLTNQAVADALVRRGHTVVVTDDEPTEASRVAAIGRDIDLVESPDRSTYDELVQASTVVLPSPGVGDSHIALDLAREHHVPVRSEFDLAEEWIRFTGKPFVFAFWAVRRQALTQASQDLPAIFQTSRDHGLEPDHTSEIAAEWAPRVGLSETEVRDYLTKSVHYQLDSGCLEGLQLFYRYASECGALPAAPPLKFVESAKFVTT